MERQGLFPEREGAFLLMNDEKRESEAVREAAVLVVGLGGLGCAAALALARSGIGSLGLADGDAVELSNLHRQLLHGPADLGALKVESAAAKLRHAFPDVAVRAHPAHVVEADAASLFAAYDFAVDATDGAAVKYLLNDAALATRTPLCHAGAIGFRGQLMTILPGRTACLRCLFPQPPDPAETAACRDGGILGPLAGLVGALEASEAVKWATGAGELATDRLLTIDARSLRFHSFAVRRSPDCVCSRSNDSRIAEECS